MLNKKEPFFQRMTPFVLCLMLFIFALPSCTSRGGKTYSDGEVREFQRVTTGTIVSVNQVTVSDKPTGLGTVIGGAVGAILGATFVGGGSGRVLTGIGGGAVGALAGTAIEGQVRKYTASEITVELDGGGLVVIVQGDDEFFVAGDKVRIFSTDSGTARVQHLQ